MRDTISGEPVEDLPGALLLDGLLQAFLLGTLVSQVVKYWSDYRDDSWRKRAFVAVVIVLSILQTALEDYKVWRTTVSDKRWSTSPIEWSDLFLNGCICSLCEGFYIRRCWKLTNKNPWVIFPLSTLSALTMAANIYLAVATGIAFRSLEATDNILAASHFLLPSTIVTFSIWIFGSLALDIIVTSILISSLWRSRTGIRETDKIVLHVILLTWESAALPSICMFIAACLYHGAPRVHDHLVLFFVLLTGKLYVFGMLRTLNSRVKLRERMKSHDLGRTSLENWSWEQSMSGGRVPSLLRERPNSPQNSKLVRR